MILIKSTWIKQKKKRIGTSFAAIDHTWKHIAYLISNELNGNVWVQYVFSPCFSVSNCSEIYSAVNDKNPTVTKWHEIPKENNTQTHTHTNAQHKYRI